MAELSPMERSLRDLGGNLDWPPTPELARHVRAQLAARRAPRRQWRWALAAAAALVLALAGVLAASPAARQTLAGWLGIRGVSIERVEKVPAPSPSRSALPTGAYGQRLGLGERTTLDQVRDPKLTRVPSRLGPPDEVYERSVGGATAVSLVYRPRPDLPADANTGAGALVVEINASLNENSFAKGVGPGTTIQRVQVRGTSGFWISGNAHAFIILSPNGSDETRLAGNVLIWTENGVTYRIESNLSLQQALALADSMR